MFIFLSVLHGDFDVLLGKCELFFDYRSQNDAKKAILSLRKCNNWQLVSATPAEVPYPVLIDRPTDISM